jgi:hypothetical protein
VSVYIAHFSRELRISRGVGAGAALGDRQKA